MSDLKKKEKGKLQKHSQYRSISRNITGGLRVCVDSVSKCLIRTAAYGGGNGCVADGSFKLLIHNPIKATLGEFSAIWLQILYLSLCSMMDEVLSACVCVSYVWGTCHM